MRNQVLDYNVLTEYGTEIKSVSDFIDEVKKLKDNYLAGSNEELFFRGQKAEFWDVSPSIFRDDYLSIEHTLMQGPLLKAPYEFVSIDNDFEIMTKYQHYGMCTRLLDLTTNPLVALFFACEKHGSVPYLLSDNENLEVKANDEKSTFVQEPYGVVFFNKGYPVSKSDRAVKIISGLAHLDLSTDNTVESVLEKLEQRKTITSSLKDRWVSADNYREFIDIIQNNYVVRAPYNNERLSRQSGMFLLASCFNFTHKRNVRESTVEKGFINLREEFESNFFYISGEYKTAILEELDTYNINEATLFPELEHQLNYIKHKNNVKKDEISIFAKLNVEDYEVIVANENCDSIKVTDNVTENHAFESTVRKFLVDKNYGFDTDIIWEEVKKWVSEVDWANQTSKLSKFKMKVKKVMTGNGKDKKFAEEEADELSEKIIQIASELS